MRLAGTGLAGRRAILACACFLVHVTANTGSPQRMCPGLGIRSDKTVTFLSPLASHRPEQEKMQQQSVSPKRWGDAIREYGFSRSFPWSHKSFKCGPWCIFSREPWPGLFTRYAHFCDEAGRRSQGLDSNSPFSYHHSTHPEGLRLPQVGALGERLPFLQKKKKNLLWSPATLNNKKQSHCVQSWVGDQGSLPELLI